MLGEKETIERKSNLFFSLLFESLFYFQKAKEAKYNLLSKIVEEPVLNFRDYYFSIFTIFDIVISATDCVFGR